MVLLNIKYMKNLILLATIFVALFSCKDDPDENIVTLSLPSVFDEYNPDSEIVMGSIFGSVYDENENPIDNALVKYNGKTYHSDKEGRFVINNEALDSKGTFFTVEADGYFRGSRRIYPQDGSINYTYVQLLALNDIGTFDSADGGEMVGDDNISISFPANSIASTTGELYNGPVTVAAKWLDPTTDNIGEIMPGDLLGLNARMEEVSLVSYGMMAVELFDINGNNINLAEGNTATLSFPVPQELLRDAPNEIPLWSYEDDMYGIWSEEGSASLQNGKYVGEVSHFSFWNCDAPFELVVIEGQLLINEKTPLANAKIGIKFNDGTSARYGTTDAKGFFTGKMPKNRVLTLSVSFLDDDCIFQDVNLGTFDTDTNVGTIILQSSGSAFTIAGTALDCFGEVITNGFISISIGENTTNYYLEGQDTFEIGLVNCNNLNEVKIEIINLDDGVVSEPSTLPIEDVVNFDQLLACENALEEFFVLTVNGKTEIELDNLTAINYTGGIRARSPLFNFTFIAGIFRLGKHEANDFVFIELETEPPFTPARFRSACDNGEGCEEIIELDLNITKYEGIGGILEANFSGLAVKSNPGALDSVAFNGKFRIIETE